MKKTVAIIPTYNEEGNIKELVERIFKIAPAIKILIVDDSSPDGTADIVKEMQLQYSNLSLLSRPVKNGLGSAYKDGIKKILSEGEAEAIIMMDADLSHEPDDIPLLLEASENFDLVIGSAHLSSDGMKEYPWHRILLSWWANFYCRQIFGYKIRDWTNAFLVISLNSFKKIDIDKLKAKEFAFLFGLRYELLKCGASCKEISSIIKLRNAGQSKMAWSTIWEGIVIPWEIRLGETLGQLVRFVISGLTVAAAGFAALYSFTEFAHIWYLYSVVLAFFSSFVISFTLQKLWTFKNKNFDLMSRQVFFYFLVTVCNLEINILIVYLLVEKVGLWYMLAQFIAEAIIAIESFIVYKFAIFKEKNIG